ncbi:Kynureninase [Salinihabitans flavidus]|uniref:Kynureninase n=1 Tax=Salinihabitans flavidus TaxID=569882 RepID=A0A1H8U4Y8_9RHOB|nr:kynureninase [Salinihabitans flavidus]SEO98126.1 Kynureninase [Salinihabitans flavidus]
MTEITRQHCKDLDAQDPLAAMRDAFHLPEGVIYLDGNSLGAQPKGARAAFDRTIDVEWREDLITSWGKAEWFTLPERLGDRLGRLFGAAPGQVVVCDTTSLNIYKALRAAMGLRPERRVIVSEKASFPTDLYMIEGATMGSDYETRLVEPEGDIADLIDADVAAVLLSNVDYRTGRLLDMERITRLAHEAGALVIWDLCHSAGVLPMEMDAMGADFAVGCTYKYLNGGPGSPAFIYVAERHQAEARQPLSGWWGHAAPFAFEAEFRPVEGIRRFLCGTQPILSMKGVEAALDVFEGIDMQTVRAKSVALCDLFIRLVARHPGCADLRLITPEAAEERGSQVSFAFDEGYAVVRAMIERGVIGDFRAPNVMRFGLAPYYLRYEDMFDAVEIMAECIAARPWEDSRFAQMAAVT